MDIFLGQLESEIIGVSFNAQRPFGTSIAFLEIRYKLRRMSVLLHSTFESA